MNGFLRDVNGDLSSKRLWATILLSNAIIMAWHGILTGNDVKLLALQFLGAGIALLGVSVAERKV